MQTVNVFFVVNAVNKSNPLTNGNLISERKTATTVNGYLAPLTPLTNYQPFGTSLKPLTYFLAVDAVNKSNLLTNGNLISERKKLLVKNEWLLIWPVRYVDFTNC